MTNISIKIKNYKCFKDETGFDAIRRVNLIIGRNNVGKSSLLDLIEIVVNNNYKFDKATWREGQPPQVIFESKINHKAVIETFPTETTGGNIKIDDRLYGMKYLDRKIKWGIAHGQTEFTLLECDDSNITPPLKDTAKSYEKTLPNNMDIPFRHKNFRRLLADRDIMPEPHSPNELSIDNKGKGITNVIQKFLNLSNLPDNLVKSNILNALNTIFAHDTVFTDIVCQLHDDSMWEIFLEENNKGRIALSKSGSGLKTIMSVLAYLILMPEIEQIPLSNYVFGFEELENNIHPALLRRLNDYIDNYAKDNNFTYFLTTHSNVLIDRFSKRKDAQIVHITQNETVSSCTTAKTYINNNGILDDLDVRASDLLQANGIIWVEGPSDRIYLNRWIELWSDGTLEEGTHYQIIFYGGRLLSHLHACSPESIKDSISILNTNRNAIMLMDSDKKFSQQAINDTKTRIIDEFNKINAFCWITNGKEVENYIPASVVNKFWKTTTPSRQVGLYTSFFDYINNIKQGDGTKYRANKPLLAEKLIPLMSMANLQGIHNLDTCMKRVCSEIEKWNS